MALPWTGISYLDIRLGSGLDTGYLYGNARHQASVVISLVPTSAGQPIAITQEELEKGLQLIDYVTESPMGTGGWRSTATATEWQTLAVDDPGELAANVNGLYQVTRYITCDPTATQRTKSIGCKVTPTAGTPILAAQNGDVDAKVTLTALKEIAYALANGNIGGFRQDYWPAPGVQHTNYFFSIDSVADGLAHRIFKMTLSVNGTTNGPFFVWHAGTPRTKVAFAWPLGPQGSQGLVAYNQRPGECCISLAKGDFDYSAADGVKPLRIDIWDQYGNRGVFHVEPDSAVPSQPDYGDGMKLLDGPPPAA